jgi:hypothetical protein
MEIHIDRIASRDKLFISPPLIENGDLNLPDRPQ